RPFVRVNCAALPEMLIASELFGHEKGVFAGAAAQKKGHFEMADGGTLFLDEIGDMPPELQTRLLRVLSDGQFYRVGGHTPITANVRVIAATHQDLDTRVKEGLFREDLYHRLNVIRLRLPSLRERREDIPLLLKHFLAKSARELNVDAKRLSETALAFLSQQEFPGNVRQLENLCHWITVMAPAQTVEVADLPADMRGSAGDKSAAPVDNNWRRALEREVTASLGRGEKEIFDGLNRSFEAALISKALEHTGGRRIEAATLLGIGRNTLTRKIQELGLGAET
ncbi:MAG: sigma 54-interacting transcriptional regulator, partial [Burkholderiales bacterium]|nr:sigma 54-interacting transcriptional regulator [Burkholderiales bacterium]